ncbi:histidine phosphatase family protein [Salinisphaera sp. T31B1]|uniref:histidine phosphatase family protein n=1 Tax=Salinisphaera sp. T31B1 TaxID=727963 RepID=UPI00333E9B2C
MAVERMPTTTTVDLLRHGECEGGPIFRGSRDVALAPAGWQRLQDVAACQAGWQRIVTSPLVRCRAFAEWLAAARALPVQVDPRLQEIGFGDWEGRPVAEVWRDDAEAAAAWYRDPEAHPPTGGERLASLRKRARMAFDAHVATGRGRHLLLVTHGGLIRTLLADLLSMPGAAVHRLDTPYACLSRLAITHAEQGESLRLLGHNMGTA